MPRRFLTQGERVRLASILTGCQEYIEHNNAGISTFIAPLLFDPGPSLLVVNDDDDVFVRALGQLVFFLVSSSKDKHDLHSVEKLVATITEDLYKKMGTVEAGYGLLEFSKITSIERSYWHARRWKRDNETKSSYVDRVRSIRIIRINEIPFAEGMYGELIAYKSESAPDETVVVEEVAWSEVGYALYSGYIDIAIHNDSIKKSFEGRPKNSRHSQQLFCSRPLFSYKNYPILENTACPNNAIDSLIVPEGSDFEDAVRLHTVLHGGQFLVPNSSTKIPQSRVKWCSNAGDAIRDLVDGKGAFCITGAIHAQFALKRFGAKGIQFRGNIAGGNPETKIRFWVLARTGEDAEEKFKPLIASWNRIATEVKRIIRLGRIGKDIPEDRILEMINSRSRRVFADKFTDVIELVAEHDTIFENVDHKIDGSPVRLW